MGVKFHAFIVSKSRQYMRFDSDTSPKVTRSLPSRIFSVLSSRRVEYWPVCKESVTP